MIAQRPDRRGLAIIPALACLILTTLLCSVLLNHAHTQRSVVRDEERKMQAEWLAESGLARASTRLATDQGYRGESWEIPARALGGAGAGVVTIVVETVEKKPGRRRVRVVADYPRGDEHRARQSKQLILDLGPENSGGSS